MQTAWLKAYFPREYMASVLTSYMGKTDKIVHYVTACRHEGTEVLPPDINESGKDFTAVPEGIRFGFAGIRGVGEGAAEAIIAEREKAGTFKNIHDFVGRVDPSQCNRRVVEALICAGAFDSLGYTRKECMWFVDKNNKQNIIDCDAQIEKYQQQLNDVANSREYDSINKEIENQDLLRQIAQKTIMDTRVAITRKKEDIEVIKDRIAIRNEDLAAKKEELATIVESTAKEEKKLEAVRDECAKKIDARTMSAYDRIRASVHNHLAVVSVYNGDSCGGCFNTITPQRLVDIASNSKLIICEHCGRIIVNPHFE
jgi:DNA polymerase III alpha subunit